MESISFQANGHEPNVKAASAEPHGERVRVGAPASSSSTVIVTHSLLSPAIIEALLSGPQQTDIELSDLLWSRVSLPTFGQPAQICAG
jgi:hypothetical protein